MARLVLGAAAETGPHNPMPTRRQPETAVPPSQAQLRQSQKLETVGRLACGIAHDVNNFATIILGHAAILSEGLEGTELAEHADQIRAAGQRAADLARRLLSFSRSETSAPRVIDLDDLIEGVVSLLRPALGDGIQIQTRMAPGLAVTADPNEMEQVFMNLILNAVDAVDAGGTIGIEAADVDLDGGSWVMVAVSDTGAGIDPAIEARIFEAFFTTKEPDKGSGLGLSIVMGIVEQHGGMVRVASEPGRGTTLTVYLPRAPALRGRTDWKSPDHGSY